MNVRLNVVLPERTVRLIDRAVPKGQRSRLIDLAVRTYVGEKGRARLHKLLREGAKARSERDLALAEEWFALDAEAAGLA
jgi:metal-responsive CopG/Arc/MetJ family transcriptional regulator